MASILQVPDLSISVCILKGKFPSELLQAPLCERKTDLFIPHLKNNFQIDFYSKLTPEKLFQLLRMCVLS